MVVNTNVAAIDSHRNMKKVGTMQMTASARLSSGLKINSAADDAAGLAISEKMRSQIRGLDMASKNSQDGISLIQTAEGGMQEIDNMLQRIRELTVQAANDTNTTSDRLNISKEVKQLSDEIESMANRVEFNTKVLLSGGFDTGVGTIHLQVGANSGQSLGVNIAAVGSSDVCLGGVTGAIEAGGSGASAFLKTLDAGLTVITDARAQLGAYQNRLEYTIKSLDISSENLSASESRIRDADMGKEMMNLTKANVLQQAATSMLAQANQNPQNVLQLLG
jgi:flagellin